MAENTTMATMGEFTKGIFINKKKENEIDQQYVESGIVVGKSVAENTTMATMGEFTKGIFINKKKENEIDQQYVESLKTKTPNVDQLVVNLSGGNQQKVVIAKWLVRNCDILIFDEPTRGIDVGAKSEIYHLMNELVAAGKSIISKEL